MDRPIAFTAEQGSWREEDHLPIDGIGTPDAPTFERVAQFLGLEIDMLRAASQRAGWNVWGILVAGSGLIWLLLDLWSRSHATAMETLRWLLATVLVVDVLARRVVFGLQRSVEPAGRAQPIRFMRIGAIGSQPPVLIAKAIRHGAFTAGTLWIATSAVGRWSWVAVVYFGSAFASDILVIALAQWPRMRHAVFPLETTDMHVGLQRFVTGTGVVTLLMGLAAVASVVLTLPRDAASLVLSIPALRIALLLWAITSLALHAVKEAGAAEEHADLHQIRRDLFLGIVTPVEAHRQATSHILGSEAGDILEEDTRRILDKYNRISDARTLALRLAADDAAGTAGQSTVRVALHAALADARQALEEGDRLLDAFTGTAIFLTMYSKSAARRASATLQELTRIRRQAHVDLGDLELRARHLRSRALAHGVDLPGEPTQEARSSDGC